MITLDAFAGDHISTVCKKAAETAIEANDSVEFVFNDTKVVAQPGESAEDLEARWNRDFDSAAEAYRNSDEYKQREAKRAVEWELKTSAVLIEKAQTESELRETESPWPYNAKQLNEYIDSLVEREHDYGTCVYAMSLAAMAAFNYVAHKVGSTGFQASCADFDFLRRSRHIDGPFILLKGEDALFPQYNLPARLQEALENWGPWLREAAIKKLGGEGTAHPDVVAHWRKLAAQPVEMAEGSAK